MFTSEELLAFVLDELPDSRTAEIEKEAEKDDRLAERIAAMRISASLYRAERRESTHLPRAGGRTRSVERMVAIMDFSKLLHILAAELQHAQPLSADARQRFVTYVQRARLHYVGMCRTQAVSPLTNKENLCAASAHLVVGIAKCFRDELNQPGMLARAVLDKVMRVHGYRLSRFSTHDQEALLHLAQRSEPSDIADKLAGHAVRERAAHNPG